MKYLSTQIYYHSTNWSVGSVCKTLHIYGNITNLKSMCMNLPTFSRNYCTICKKVQSRPSLCRSTNNSFIRAFSKNNQLNGILERRQLVDLNNFHKARFLLKAQSLLDNTRVSGFGSGGSVSLLKEWNKDMVRAMQRMQLNQARAKKRSSDDTFEVQSHLEEINRDIIEYFKSLKTHKTLVTDRKQIMLYSDEELKAEADEFSNRILTAWQRMEKTENKEYILPEGNPYSDNVMTKASKMHIELKAEFPGNIANTNNWKVFVFDVPTIFNACALMNGHIYISKGLIDSISDAHLAFLIGHEMSHVYLKHSGETESIVDFYEGFTWTVMCNIEKAVPDWSDDAKMSLIERFQETLMKEFPSPTIQEAEANDLGFYLATKAQIDPIKSDQFFKTFSEVIPPEASDLQSFHDIEGINNALHIKYKCPSEPRNPSQWMKDYVKKMDKWKGYHQIQQESTASLGELIVKRAEMENIA